jgi:perosamine synthetase
MNIPLCIPSINEEEINAVKEVLESGWLVHGPKTKEFEKKFAEYIETKYATTLNSCTSALQLALQANNLKGEVILPSFTFVASANATITAGCKPVFIEIDPKTFNINPEKIEEKITENTVAIMPVHFAGQPCNMGPILEIAEKHNLMVIEDSAECIGGEYKKGKTGSFGVGCFSFFPTKNMTTAEGGMITTNDEEFLNKVNILKAHGISSTTFEREKQEKPWLRAAIEAGYNFRMNDVLSAIGLVQLKKLEEMNNNRIKNANYLTEQLSEIKEIETPYIDSNCKHVYQMYIIKLNPKINRTEFIKKLKEKGIGANVHFDPPVHLHPYYKERCPTKLPITEEISQRIVTLPMFPSLTKEQMDYIVNSIKEII